MQGLLGEGSTRGTGVGAGQYLFTSVPLIWNGPGTS